jgi:hypothetical protein
MPRPALALLLLVGCAARPPAPPEGPRAGAVNATFHAVYARARAREAAAGPRIVVDPARVTLHLGAAARESVALGGPAFHALKAFAHLPLAAYVIARPGSAGLAAPREVEDLLAAIADAEAELPRSPLAPAQQARARDLADAARALLQRHLRGPVPPDALAAFARAAAPAMLASTADAARIYVDQLHAVVVRWRAALPSDQWARLRVLVRGAHQARRLAAPTQYFAGLLGECGAPLGLPGEGGRVHYLELAPASRAEGDQLPGLAELDAEVATAFFADPERLATDLLADGVRARLAELGGFTALPCAPT